MLLQSHIVAEATGPLSGLEGELQISGLLACCEIPKALKRRITETVCKYSPFETAMPQIYTPKCCGFQPILEQTTKRFLVTMRIPILHTYLSAKFPSNVLYSIYTKSPFSVRSYISSFRTSFLTCWIFKHCTPRPLVTPNLGSFIFC